MTRTIDLEQEKLGLEEVVGLVQSGDEVVVTRGIEQIARVTQIESTKSEKESLLGTHRGWVSYIADDFDAELPDSFWLGEE